MLPATPWRRGSAAAIVILVVAVAGLGAWRLADGLTESGTPANPDAGLTDAQRMDLHATVRAEGIATMKAWTLDYLSQEHDYRALPRVASMKLYIGSLPDLATAVHDATLIVSGTVGHTQFRWDDPMEGVMADVTVRVDRVLKGNAGGDTVTLTQDGGPTINFGTGEVLLGQDEIDPILLDGDRVVLFLQPGDVPRWAPWFSQGWTGQYTVDAQGDIHPIEGNAFGDEVDGMPLATFEAKVAALATGG